MKKLLLLLSSISLLTSGATSVLACKTNTSPGSVIENHEPAPFPASTGYQTTRTEFVNKADIENGISKDADRKKTSENVSVYFLKRNAAFAGVQSLLSITNTLQNGQEVYYSISQNIGSEDANGENAIDYAKLATKFIDQFHFQRTNNNLTYILREDLAPIFNSIGDKKVDLYFEDFQLFDAAAAGVSLVEQLVPYFKQINTITITTDGTSQLEFEKQNQVWIENLSIDYKNLLTEMWTEIINGDINKIESKYFQDLDKIMPTLILKNAQNEKFINAWAASAQIYVDSLEQPYAWNQMSTGLADAYKRLTIENQTLIKEIYAISDINLDDGDYIIHSGNLIKGFPDERLESEAKNLQSVYEKDKSKKIIYKPHPREDEKYYELLFEKVANLLDSDTAAVKEWLSIARALTPIEVFALTGVYKSSNNKTFEYSVTATSTTVLALYEAEAKSDVQQYVFESQTQKKYYELIYGNNNDGVIDWGKAYINN